jgi:hypothetical protein
MPLTLVLNRTISEKVVSNRTGSNDAEVFVEYWTILTNNTGLNWTESIASPNIVTVSSEMPTGFTASLASTGIIGLCMYNNDRCTLHNPTSPLSDPRICRALAVDR